MRGLVSDVLFTGVLVLYLKLLRTRPRPKLGATTTTITSLALNTIYRRSNSSDCIMSVFISQQ